MKMLKSQTVKEITWEVFIVAVTTAATRLSGLVCV